MSRLDELIQELCPDGVEYKRLGDCCYLQKGTTPIQKAIPGEYPLVVTTDERKSSNTYQFDAPTVCIPLVSSRGHGVACLNQVYYQEGTFALGNILCGATPKADSGLSARFLYYYLNYKKDTLIVPLMKGGANVSLTVDSLKRVKVVVPPLDVQVEIICILDKFIALSAELKAELTARKKQYRYYMDTLLTTEGTEYSLEDVCLIVDCPHTSPKWKEYGVPVIRNYNLTNGVIDTTNLSYVDEEEYKIRIKRITPQQDDILFSREAPIGNVGIVPKNFRCCQGQRVVLLRPRKDIVFPQFLLYILQSGVIHKQIERIEKIGSTVSNFNISDLKKLRFSIPPIDIQMAISQKLDFFSKICIDISGGLPAEIEARQKQYEYYRDRLLTFKERTHEPL